MPIQLPITDPYTLAVNTEAFAWGRIIGFDAEQKTIRLVYLTHPSAAAAFSGGAPYPKTIEVTIGPVARAAEYGPAPMTDPGAPAVWSTAVPPTFQLDGQGQPVLVPVLDGDGQPVTEPVLDGEGNPVLDGQGQPTTRPVLQPVILDPGAPSVIVTPAVAPTYGAAPVIRPRVPSYDEVVMANLDLFVLLADRSDALVVQIAPECMTGAAVIPRSA